MHFSANLVAHPRPSATSRLAARLVGLKRVVEWLGLVNLPS